MTATPAIQHYLDLFTQKKLPRDSAPWMHELRQDALSRFAAQGFPGTKQEHWKYTSLYPLEQQQFTLPGTAQPAEAPAIAGLDCDTLVFVNGQLQGEPPALPAGVTLTPLAHALGERPGRRLGTLLADRNAGAFKALNTAFLQDGVLLELADGAALEKPLRIVYLSRPADQATMMHPRIIIRLGKNAAATVIEQYAGEDGAANFTNAVTQVELARDAALTHHRLQDESTAQFHLARIEAVLERDSRYAGHNFMLGGRLARSEYDVQLAESGAEVLLNGLSLAGGQQHHDNRLLVTHAVGDTRSVQNCRAVVAGRARSVWNGKVLVEEGADGTDAAQSSKNLLLDKIAEADAKPELEIYADEVKCSHGATVGQLDEDAFFYLRSRGVDAATARSLLVFAFADDVLSRVGIPALRKHLETRVIERLPDNDRIREFA